MIVEFKLGELFCGPGGLALGAFNAQAKNQDMVYKISHGWANDYDKDTCETYRKNFSSKVPAQAICRDVRKLEFKKLSPIDALAFGFPCNDFSVVGEQKGIDGVYGPLYSYGIKALKYFNPKWFLAENVGGLKNANDGNTFQTILVEMFKAGYNITPHLYKFEKYGVPQARHRLIIVGIRKDIDVTYRVPAVTHEQSITCKDAIENPLIPMTCPY